MASRKETWRAIAQVRQLQLDGDVDALIAELDNPLEWGRLGNWIVRAHAAYALGQLRDARAVPQLIALGGDPSEHVRTDAIGALAKIGDPTATTIFLKGLDDPERLVRIRATMGLSAVGATEAIERLRQVFEDDEDHWVRLYAAEALDALGDSMLTGLIPGELARLRWWQRQERKRLARLSSGNRLSAPP